MKNWDEIVSERLKGILEGVCPHATTDKAAHKTFRGCITREAYLISTRPGEIKEDG